ncbi:MAG TPA: polyprenyl synthetase family protein [Terriglobia bacterium]|nr:polyprenyl synthetase family protein [Terriglobia bacterium]
MNPQYLYELVAPELAQVEEELRQYAHSSVRTISEIGEYILNGGGKRIRPMLLLLTSRMVGEITPGSIRLAAVVELIHNATLVHDDIIDGADTRRGRPSANSAWGNSMTVLAGDWLYMQSFAVALRERNLEILSTLIEVTQKMVEGELLQLTLIGNPQATPEALLDIVERKTGWLFAGCMKLPGIVAGLDQESISRLADIGRNLGMAFQLVDDLLDLTSSQKTLGKPVGNDLREGKVTLPVSFVMRNGNTGDTERVTTVLQERAFHSVDSADILRSVEASDGLRKTRAIAESYAIKAKALLEVFEPSPYRDALVHIPEFILNRSA